MELLVSMTLLSLIMIVLTAMIDSAHRAWKEGQNRTESFQSARTCLELMARELSPAVVDTRTQMIVAPGAILENQGAANVAPNSPAILWMAPLGENGDLRCVGYYLYRDTDRKFYRLKRLYVGPKDAKNKDSVYYPKMVNLTNALDADLRTSPVNGEWFTRQWDAKTFDEEDPDNDDVIVSTAADGVVAFWVQSLDLQGNPIPSLAKDHKHPKSDLSYNSAAYFQVSTSGSFEDDTTFKYLKASEQGMKGNRVPAAVELTLVTVDTSILDRGLEPPHQSNVYKENGTLDVEKSLRLYEDELRSRNIKTARSFSTRAKLINGN